MSDGIVGLALGGVGLFLLGMLLMTDGLKAAAGPTLGRVLGSVTATRWRGLFSGIFVTAMVQSSSAVTVAAIGFVNAGLLSFSQSLWVLFGANVGTTMTGWLVALIGLKIKVEAAALPLIGIGMALRLSGPETRRGAIGGALAGFGVLFLGIGFLQQGFAGSGSAIDLAAFGGLGWRSVLAFVGAGLLLTILMQSSSAALAVVLTLAETGVIPTADAAAAVIGANVGTTVTALLAAIGATANARRAAAAHVLFNVLTGLVALGLLPFLMGVVDWLRALLEMDAAPAVTLALFHTVFNLLGVLLMWPLADRLAQFLQRRFRHREEDLAQPRYLDLNVATVPSLAVDALRRELGRLGGLAVSAVLGRLAGAPATAGSVPAAASLSHAISGFVARMHRGAMSASSADALARLLRAQRYYDHCAELAAEADSPGVPADRLDPTLREPLAELLDEFLDQSGELLRQLAPDTETFAPASAHQRERIEERYQPLKAALLAAGARGALELDAMVALLRRLSALRRAIDQADKAAHLLTVPALVDAAAPLAASADEEADASEGGAGESAPTPTAGER
jgi:phosphate:Na+ symporter